MRSAFNVLHTLAYAVGLHAARTQTTPDERALLARLAPGKRTLVEIGVFEGVSSRLLRQHMDADATLYLIDPFPPGRLGFSPQWFIANREVNRARTGNVVFLRQMSFEARQAWSRPIDMLFYDAAINFDDLCRDFADWSPLLTGRAPFLLHTSRSSPVKPVPADAGTVRFVAELPALFPEFEVAEFVDSTTVIRRREDCCRESPA